MAFDRVGSSWLLSCGVGVAEFEAGMEALFKVPKSAVLEKKKQARKPATLRKPKKSGKDKV